MNKVRVNFFFQNILQVPSHCWCQFNLTGPNYKTSHAKILKIQLKFNFFIKIRKFVNHDYSFTLFV